MEGPERNSLVSLLKKESLLAKCFVLRAVIIVQKVYSVQMKQPTLKESFWEMFAEIENEPATIGPSKPTMNQAGIETMGEVEPPIQELDDTEILAALQQDTKKLEDGVTDADTFEDSRTDAEAPVTELEEDSPPSMKATQKQSPKMLMDSLIGKSNNALRLSGTKKGAWRVQPSDSNNPPAADLMLRFLKSAKLSVIKIIKAGGGGGASTKFNTYVVTKPGAGIKVSFVYGQGRNEGQKFEATAINSIKNAAKGKFDSFSKEVFGVIGINPKEVASVELASSKRVKRPLSTDLANVGPMISDMDIVLKSGIRIYVSLKNESGATFANSGYKGGFAIGKVGSKIKLVSTPHRLDDFVVSALGINKALVASGITDYANKVATKNPQINTPARFDAVKIEQYLASAYGYGYWYVRQRGSGVEVVDLTTAKKMLSKLGKVTGVVVTYPFWSTGRSTKQLTAKITTTTGTYVVEIRNSQAALEPNEIKVKTGGSKK